MGQSTDAILFFGFVWDEETRYPWNIGRESDDEENDDDDWEARYARLKGLPEPPPIPDKGIDPRTGQFIKNYTPEEQAIVDRRSAYWDEKRALIDKVNVEVDTHCCGDCPMPFVAHKASKTRAWRGNPMEVTSLEIKPEWEQELRAFCELMGINVKDQQPKWRLVSDWN